MSAADRGTVLMLVWTSVATDSRVLREAQALVSSGRRVHIVGRAVPADFTPPSGVTVSSEGVAPRSEGRTSSRGHLESAARWALLPLHVSRRMKRWQVQAEATARSWAQENGQPSVVHAHDYSALPVGQRLAEEWMVPLVYDTHEYWVGRATEGRPAPVLRRRERREEARLGASAAAVVTVGRGVAEALRSDHPDWPEISVVRNTFPLRTDEIPVADTPRVPQALVYAGRVGPHRELETIAKASLTVDLPITLIGPSDDAWLSGFERGRTQVLPSETLPEVDKRLISAGAALVTVSDQWANNRLAQPNKLFHAASLGVPVIATDVGELAGTVREFGLGTLYRPGDSEDLARAMRALIEGYPSFVEAVRLARMRLNWGHDAQVLLGVYDGLSAH